MRNSLSNHALRRTNYVLVLLLGVIYALAACGKANEPASAERGVSFRTIDSGSRPASGSQGSPSGRLLCSEGEARAAFESWRLPAPARSTAIAGSGRSCVIAVLAGSRPGSGFRLRFDKLELRRGQPIVTVTIRRPPGIIDAATISRPYATAEVPSSAFAQARHEVLVRETPASE